MKKKRTKLDEEIDRVYERLQKLDPETEEYAKVEENWIKLVAQKLESEKHESDKKDRGWRYVIETGKTILPLGVTVVFSLLAWQIEAKGGSGIPFNFGKRFVERLTKY